MPQDGVHLPSASSLYRRRVVVVVGTADRERERFGSLGARLDNDETRRHVLGRLSVIVYLGGSDCGRETEQQVEDLERSGWMSVALLGTQRVEDEMDPAPI